MRYYEESRRYIIGNRGSKKASSIATPLSTLTHQGTSQSIRGELTNSVHASSISINADQPFFPFFRPRSRQAVKPVRRRNVASKWWYVGDEQQRLPIRASSGRPRFPFLCQRDRIGRFEVSSMQSQLTLNHVANWFGVSISERRTVNLKSP